MNTEAHAEEAHWSKRRNQSWRSGLAWSGLRSSKFSLPMRNSSHADADHFGHPVPGQGRYDHVHFMHLKYEKFSLVLWLVPAMIFCICMMFIFFFPEAFRLLQMRPHEVKVIE